MNASYPLPGANENFIRNVAKLSNEQRKLSIHCRIFNESYKELSEEEERGLILSNFSILRFAVVKQFMDTESRLKHVT